ncbi:hypothetical protein LIER_44036 [Lithospermum erythrorhizon]|uniref:Uncharacterized protein n=1 Tax=Lithospermum erythrorhizon TaxID=34254 RepID=A0AAV3RQV1_LITER
MLYYWLFHPMDELYCLTYDVKEVIFYYYPSLVTLIIHVDDGPNLRGPTWGGSLHNGIRCLKYSKNVVRFVSLTHKYMFINMYFIGSSNIELLDDIDDDGEYSISVSRALAELIKASASKRAMLTVIPFNLGDNNDGVDVNEVQVNKGRSGLGLMMEIELSGSQPSLSATFLENIDEKFGVPDHDSDSEIGGEVHSDDNDYDYVVESTGGAAPTC